MKTKYELWQKMSGVYKEESESVKTELKVEEAPCNVWYKITNDTHAMYIKNCGCLVKTIMSKTKWTNYGSEQVKQPDSYQQTFVPEAILYTKVIVEDYGNFHSWKNVSYFMEGKEQIKDGPYR